MAGAISCGVAGRVEGEVVGTKVTEEQRPAGRRDFLRSGRIPHGEAIPKTIYNALRTGKDDRALSEIKGRKLAGTAIMRRIFRTGAQYGRLELLRSLDGDEAVSQRDVDVAFLLASGFGHTPLAAYLHEEQGAHLDARTSRHGNQAMHMSFRYTHADTARYLHGKGASIGSPDGYFFSRPIHIAALKGSPEMYRLAIELKADKDARTAGKFMQTAAHIAAFYGSIRMLQEQADSGTDFNVPDAFGFNPLDIARRAYQKKAKEFLLEHGGETSASVIAHAPKKRGGMMKWESDRIRHGLTSTDPNAWNQYRGTF